MMIVMDERFRWKYATDAEWAARVNLVWEQQRREREQDAKERGTEAERDDENE